MALTSQQLATLKAHIAADPVLSAFPMNSDGAFEIAAMLNQPATPDFWVYRESVTQDEIMQNGFDWVRVDNLTIGKARIWEWLFKNSQSAMNPSKANVRAGIQECWKGTAADLAVRAAVFAHCAEKATKAEKLFATGTGSPINGDGVGPATRTFSGLLSYQDVEQARNS